MTPTLVLACPQDGRKVQAAICQVSVGGEVVVQLSTGPLRIVVHVGDAKPGTTHEAVSET